ncbi:MAG: DUF4234 domain-containing protein [Clostridia bacterium]|nr:DUF4234 domain-containing protein [Clostridia bacterium]
MAYQFPYDYEEKETRRAKLPTNRSMWKLMLLSFLTCGIYGVIFFIPFSFDLEKISPYSISRQMNYIWAHLLSLFTFALVIDIWHYQTAKRVEEALEYRGIDYRFGTRTFWGWFVLGSLILIGPFVYFHKLCKAMNLLCKHYNEHPVVPASN